MKYEIYDIVPVPKPRQTRSSKFKIKPGEAKYYAFKDQVALANMTLPDSGYHVMFILPMPKSWSPGKKEKMNLTMHLQTPDKDNMEKALLDSLFKNDSHIWDGRVSKFWGYEGKLIIIEGIDVDWMFEFLKEVLVK